jgi:sugar lactone lactonase YvrE
MITKIEKLFRSPYSVPNGLQVTEDGLWIVDQITDRVALVEITADEDYTVPKLIRDIPSESSNTSGMTSGGGALWLAANGPGERWRPVRDTDAKPGDGEIFQVDPATGETLGRYPIPDGGGTHGVEYDHYDEGHLWVQTLKDQVTHKVRISDWSIQKTLPLPYGRGHGMVRVEDGLWSTHTSDRAIVKLNLEDGTPIDKIVVPEGYPEPHGLSIYGDDFLYCDASSGWVAKITWE